MIAIALLGWAFFAAAYAHAEQDWGSGAGRRALRVFFANAIQQVPNMGAVLSFVFTKRLWLVGIVAGLEGLAVLLGWKMRSLEREMATPRHRRR